MGPMLLPDVTIKRKLSEKLESCPVYKIVFSFLKYKNGFEKINYVVTSAACS